MMKKNIVLFTWENEVFLKRDLNKWISVFTEKYGAFNVYRYNSENISLEIFNNISSNSFFDNNKLIVVNGLPLNSTTKDDKLIKIEEKFVSILENISEDVFVLFVETNPDRKRKLYKKLEEIGTIKNYNNLSWFELKNYIRSRLNIGEKTLWKLYEYCLWDFSIIERYTEKLELFKPNWTITEDDIDENIIQHNNENIFNFIDIVLSWRKKEIIKTLNNINDEYPYFLASLITNFRNIVYCQKLIDEGINKAEISSNLWVKDYYLRTATYHVSKKEKIFNFWANLIEIDNKIKKWELIPDNSGESFRMEMEKIIIM